MIKLVKLNTTYIDLNFKVLDIFMVISSDSSLLEYGDFILDDKELNTQIEEIEDYLNSPSVNSDKVNDFTYKIKDIKNQNAESEFIKHTQLFLLSIFREYQLKNIIAS